LCLLHLLQHPAYAHSLSLLMRSCTRTVNWQKLRSTFQLFICLSFEKDVQVSLMNTKGIPNSLHMFVHTLLLTFFFLKRKGFFDLLLEILEQNSDNKYEISALPTTNHIPVAKINDTSSEGAIGVALLLKIQALFLLRNLSFAPENNSILFSSGMCVSTLLAMRCYACLLCLLLCNSYLIERMFSILPKLVASQSVEVVHYTISLIWSLVYKNQRVSL